jgi:hypothetical protein
MGIGDAKLPTGREEEGMWATWLYDSLKPHVTEIVVCGLGIESHSSAEDRYVDVNLPGAKKPAAIRGLNRNHNHELKNLFNSAATLTAACCRANM